MSKLDNLLFSTGIILLILCIFLTFLFFSPKQISETEDLIYVGNLNQGQMKDLALSLIEEGDLVLTKPKSLFDNHEYDRKIEGKPNKFTNFFFYNLFDKILINSMGDTYWHVAIYVGDDTINSLYLETREELIDEIFLEHKYFKVLSVETSEINKKLAIERANEHLKNQDIYYSLKNGLLISFLESTGWKKEFDIKKDELVCSSYIASIYEEVSFHDRIPTHITPVALEFSDKTNQKSLPKKASKSSKR